MAALGWLLNLDFAAGGTVGTPPTITTTTLPDGQVGTAYNQTIVATGDATITFAVTVGSLPSGLSLNAGTGAITGAPTVAGSYSFTVEATNSSGSDTQAYTVGIVAAADAFTGGFYHAFESAVQKRRKRLKELEEREEETRRISDETDRQIAEIFRSDERKQTEAEENTRLQRLAAQYETDAAVLALGERVAKATARAALQGNFSAVEALIREIQRSIEEEQFLIQAAILAIELNDGSSRN